MKKPDIISLLIVLLAISLCCITIGAYIFEANPKPPAYMPTFTATPIASPAITPAYDLRFDNFTAHTNGEIKFKAFGKSSYALSDLKWIVNGEEIKDYSKIWVDYDIGTANTMIKAGGGQLMFIKTGQSWIAGTQISILIIEKSCGIVLAERNLIVQY